MNATQMEIHDIRCELEQHIRRIEQRDTVSLDCVVESLDELSDRLNRLTGGAEIDATAILEN